MEPIVGIDLGTTNSEVAVVRDRQPVVLEEDGDPILPSFVGLSEDGRLLVGKAAKNQWVLAPERTVKSIKRKMGQDVKVKLGDQEYRPQEISAMILKALEHYDIPPQALEFYRIHVEAEEEHGDNAEKAVAPFVQTRAQQALVRHAFRWTVVALAGMQMGFDAVLDA